jgi:hypothetical protein
MVVMTTIINKTCAKDNHLNQLNCVFYSPVFGRLVVIVVVGVVFVVAAVGGGCCCCSSSCC